MKYFKPAIMAYLLFIVLLNTIFSYVPNLMILGFPVSPADFLVGLIYVLRDFGQRESHKGVLIAMIIGCFISFLLAEKQAAFASLSAFAVGETLDWIIFTCASYSLSKRILLSSFISMPADSIINLGCLHQLNAVGLTIMLLTKSAGILLLWIIWRTRTTRPNKLQVNIV